MPENKVPKITRDQTELTPEQLELAKEYAKKQIKKYLATIDKAKPKKTIERCALNAYKISGTKLPKKVRWFKSPEAMYLYGASVGYSVGYYVGVSVSDSVRDSVESSVWDSVWDSVESSVWDSVWDSVWGSVGVSMWDSVGDSVRAYYDANTWSFYGFFHKYFEPNKIVWLLKLSENVTGYAFYEKECWLVEKPKRLELDEAGKLHSITGKAIEWKDKTGYYFIHGVRFDEKLWKQIKNKRVHLKTIFSLENIEQRMAALKLHGVEKLLSSSHATKLDHSERGNELYLIKDVFSQDAYYLKYTCPSTGRVYVSGVDPRYGEEEDADLAMAWKFGLSKEEYLGLEIES